MQNNEKGQVRVKAFYRHGPLFFELPPGTLKADFAALLDSFGRTYGEPLAVELTLPSQRAASSI